MVLKYEPKRRLVQNYSIPSRASMISTSSPYAFVKMVICSVNGGGNTGGTYGYSIGFDTKSLMHVASLSNFSFGKCIYEAEVQRTIVREPLRIASRTK